MTKEEIVQIIREELKNVLKEIYGKDTEQDMCPVCKSSTCTCNDLEERTVARREPPRKMTKKQVSGRDGIGKKLLGNKRAVSYFKKKFGKDWKSYLYASATNKAIDKHD
jgi:hypothetical protein